MLARVELPIAARARVNSVLGLIAAMDVEVELFAKLVAARLREHPGYRAIQVIPGVGPVLAAVFVAEIGDVTRFPGPAQLASWAGLTPKHHESDTTVHRAGSPNRVPAWFAGPRSRPCNGFRCTPASGRPVTGSPSAAAATSVSSPRPAS